MKQSRSPWSHHEEEFIPSGKQGNRASGNRDGDILLTPCVADWMNKPTDWLTAKEIHTCWVTQCGFMFQQALICNFEHHVNFNARIISLDKLTSRVIYTRLISKVYTLHYPSKKERLLEPLHKLFSSFIFFFFFKIPSSMTSSCHGHLPTFDLKLITDKDVTFTTKAGLLYFSQGLPNCSTR